MGTSAGQVILFGTIPTTIPDTTPTMTPPTTHITYPASPDYSPASDTEPNPSKDPSSDRIPPLPATLPFLSSTGDSSDSDTPDTPPLPTHDHFTSDDSLRDSPSSSLSETSSDSYSNALSDSSFGHSSSDHSSPALPLGMRSSHQLCSSVPSIPHSSAAITKRPSYSSYAGPSRKRTDLLPPRKRIRSSDFVTDLEVSSDESSESSVPREPEIDECIAYEDALRAGWIDARVVVETFAREEVETSARGTVEVRDDRVTHPMVSDDIPEPA
ncbi:hypothetical protein Tco_0168406 [Tanacetum coccineum]